MGLFEQFPYSNFHQLNLDWLIQEIQKLGNNAVLSVNGKTGNVILYESENIVFPEVESNTWRMVRVADGHTAGVMFQNGLMYVMFDNTAERVYTVDHPPTYPVTSVNGDVGAIVLYKDAGVRFPDVDDGYMNIRRQIDSNGTPSVVGVQVDKNRAERMEGANRYTLYDSQNQPPYPVTSVNGKTGAVILAIPFEEPLTDSIWFASEASQDHVAGVGRETTDGTVEFYLDTSSGQDCKAYIHFVSTDEIHTYTKRLLTVDDIPSSTGVVSINGQAGVVVLYGTDINMSNLDNTPVTTAITNNKTAIQTVNNALAPAIDPDTMTCAVAIPKNEMCHINGVFYRNTSGAVLPANTAISMANLTAIGAGGVLNDELEHPAMYDTVITRTASASHTFTVPDGSCNLFIFEGNGGSRMFSALIYRATGTITIDQITRGSGIDSITQSGNTFTVTPASTNSCFCRVFNVAGDPIY